MMKLDMHRKNISLVASSAVGALVIGVTLCVGGVSAVEQTGSATATVNVAVGSCSFERSAGSGTYMGTLANGAAPISVTGSTFKTLCNDGGGYAVYAVGYSNDELGNTDLISNLGASDNIHTGVYVDSSSPSSWAMKLENNSNDYAPAVINNATGSDFTTFHAVPNNYTKVASFVGSTLNPGSGSTGSTITATYQAYASYTQPAGTYTGQVKYTMVHPGTITAPSICPANSICYSPNADGAVNGSMGNQAVTSDATSATLLASNFWRTGYGFAGWNTEYDGSGTFYGPNEDIEFEAGQYSGVNGGLSLYAIWVKSAGYLQGWNGCQSLAQTTYDGETGKLVAGLSSITALTDKRDNQTYAVARLADGNCWMIENLRLNNNSANPNWGNNNLSQGFGGAFTGLANPEADFSSSTTANSLYSTTNITGDNQGYRFPRYRNDNIASPASNITSTNANIYSYGNYYTWAAAIANTTNYTTYSGVNGSDAAGTSLCPAGWQLPLGYQSTGTIESGSGDATNRVKGFSYLDRKMGGTGNNQSSLAATTQSKVWSSFPNNFLYSGYPSNYTSNIVGRGSYGYYWSSSAYLAGYTYVLRLNSSHFDPGTNGSSKDSGCSVRCVLGS